LRKLTKSDFTLLGNRFIELFESFNSVIKDPVHLGVIILRRLPIQILEEETAKLSDLILVDHAEFIDLMLQAVEVLCIRYRLRWRIFKKGFKGLVDLLWFIAKIQDKSVLFP
jgi:hypothetical protein